MQSNKKYLKVMFKDTSSASNYQYKVDEINIADTWNPLSTNPKEMGGFNFSTEDKILRWLVRGDTLYDVIIPEDAEVIECESKSAPHGVFRSNKIMICNPRLITDELAMQLYLNSNLPEVSYYKALAGLAIRGHINTCKKIIKDRISSKNIDLVLSEIEDFIRPENRVSCNENDTLEIVMEILDKIKKDK